jgi:hypothetical protein
MRLSKTKIDDTTLLIDEQKTTTPPIPSSLHKDHHSSIQCHTIQKDNIPCSIDKPSPPAEYIYTEIVKAIGNNEFIEEKRLLKRASWSPAVLQEFGLPPNGKRTNHEQITTNRNSNRVRMRPKVARYYQPPQQQHPHHHHQTSFGRPLSFNERYDHQQQKLSNSSLVSYIEQNDFKYVVFLIHFFCLIKSGI